MIATTATRAATRSPEGGRVVVWLRPAAAMAVLLALSLAGVPANAPAAALRMGPFAPVGDVADKQVQSMRERKYAHLVEQQTDFSCGAAALATILRFAYDKEGATEKRILKGLFQVADEEKVRKKGFSLLDLKRFVEAIGMRARGYRVAADTLSEIRVPTIALIDLDGYRHFVVVRTVEDGRVFVGDPALGNRAMPLEAFIDAWNGIVFAVIGTGYDEETALLQARETISARELHDIYAPVPRAETIGYGLRHTEMF